VAECLQLKVETIRAEVVALWREELKPHLKFLTIIKIVIILLLIAAAIVVFQHRDVWAKSAWMPSTGVLTYLTFRLLRQLFGDMVRSGPNDIPAKAQADTVRQQESKARSRGRWLRILRWAQNTSLYLFAIAVMGCLVWLSITLIRWFWFHPLFR
jgi:hypothetical protein